MSSDLTFTYEIRLANSDELREDLDAIDGAAASVSATGLATGSHVAACTLARIGFRNEDDLLERREVVWSERGTDARVATEVLAQRVLEAFLTDLRSLDLADLVLEDVWPADARVTLDPRITIRLGQRPGPTPEHLRSLVADAVRE